MDPPKNPSDALSQDRSLSLFEWIDMAGSLGAEGLELYDGFLLNLQTDYLDQVGEALAKAGFAMPMMCSSPDFTTSAKRSPYSTLNAISSIASE